MGDARLNFKFSSTRGGGGADFFGGSTLLRAAWDKLKNNLVIIVVGIIGNITSVAAIFTHVPTFRNIIKEKNIRQLTPISHFLTWSNFVLWISFGVIGSSNNVIVITLLVL
ncbi:hypothetical protein ACFE04_027972 [Oxalis oulophora]